MIERIIIIPFERAFFRSRVYNEPTESRGLLFARGYNIRVHLIPRYRTRPRTTHVPILVHIPVYNILLEKDRGLILVILVVENCNNSYRLLPGRLFETFRKTCSGDYEHNNNNNNKKLGKYQVKPFLRLDIVTKKVASRLYSSTIIMYTVFIIITRFADYCTPTVGNMPCAFALKTIEIICN